MARALDKSEWANYCDRLSHVLVSSNAEIEVASLELGSQIETQWVPFHGISYDHEDDIIDIELEGMDHIINHPKSLRAYENDTGVLSLEIKDEGGAQHVVRLKDVLALPSP
jgi:hypothetical protein